MTTANILSLIAIAISVIVGGTSIYFNSKNSKRTDTKDTEQQMKEKIEEIKERTKENAIINAKLDTISSSNQEIKEQVSSLVKKIDLHESRLIKVEESLTTAWKRIDEIVEKIDKEDD